MSAVRNANWDETGCGICGDAQPHHCANRRVFTAEAANRVAGIVRKWTALALDAAQFAFVMPALAVFEFAFAMVRISPPCAHVKTVVRAPTFDEILGYAPQLVTDLRTKYLWHASIASPPPITEISNRRTARSGGIGS